MPDWAYYLRRPNENWTRRDWWSHQLRTWACAHGLHRSTFVYDIVPAYLGEDPTPPEDGWGCKHCAREFEPRWWWLASRTIWPVKQWWYERPGGAFDKEFGDV